MLKIKNVTKNFGDLRAPDRFSLEVEKKHHNYSYWSQWCRENYSNENPCGCFKSDGRGNYLAS